MKSKFWPGNLIGGALGLVLLGMAPATSADTTVATYDLSWNTIAGGGASFTTAGTYTLGATIGQAAIGPMSGAAYALYSGFWAVTSGRVIDVDGNGVCDALTDGLLILRYLFGLRGPSLTAGAIGTGHTRSTPAEIESYIVSIKPLLDVDGNGTQDALSDGLMILRYLFGLRGASVTAGAVGLGATRTGPQMEAYVVSLMP